DIFICGILRHYHKWLIPASKKQKEDLRYLVKYHKIDLPVQIDHLSRNEASRLTDQIISQYGRTKKTASD
ncbi:MAG: 3'-5' exonuclease, partial [Eubacteriales bacterium]|nr:3'-5' exonuclease [Eubacteriales bacterium]